MSRFNIANSRASFVDPETGALAKYGKDVLTEIAEYIGLIGSVDSSSIDDAYGDLASVEDDRKAQLFGSSRTPTEAQHEFRQAAINLFINRYPSLARIVQQGGHQFTTSPTPTPFYSVSANHTCYGSENIEATSNITVFLPAKPTTKTIVRVKRNTGAGAVTVDGNGINIDGAATQSLATNYDAQLYIYSPTSNEYLQF